MCWKNDSGLTSVCRTSWCMDFTSQPGTVVLNDHFTQELSESQATWQVCLLLFFFFQWVLFSGKHYTFSPRGCLQEKAFVPALSNTRHERNTQRSFHRQLSHDWYRVTAAWNDFFFTGLPVIVRGNDLDKQTRGWILTLYTFLAVGSSWNLTTPGLTKQ